jgi:hypothetical protein
MKIAPHADVKILSQLFPYIRKYQALAAKHGIDDIFQDNGGKILQLALILGIKVLPSREGNDAIDANGNEFELKTLNILKRSSFTTHHHMNPNIISKYRKVDWIFATYEAIELKEIFKLTPDQMEPLYKVWEAKWHADGGKDINNPKVPLRYVRANGVLLHSSVGTALENTLP